MNPAKFTYDDGELLPFGAAVLRLITSDDYYPDISRKIGLAATADLLSRPQLKGNQPKTILAQKTLRLIRAKGRLTNYDIEGLRVLATDLGLMKSRVLKGNPMKKYQTWAGWKRAAKEAGASLFEGDKDIAQAFGVVDSSRPAKEHPGDYSNLFSVGEWDGAEGIIYESARKMPRLMDDYPTKNPRASRDTFRVGDKVIGIMGVDGGYAGVVTGVTKDSRGRFIIVTYRDAESGEERVTFDFNLSKNVPARGVFPRRNPLRRRPGESERDFMARCMSAEKKKFPRQDQRVAVCLSKSRRNPDTDLEV